MIELETLNPDTLTPLKRANTVLFLCDESSINCASFRKIQYLIESSGHDVVLAIPDEQYQTGLRGWAKAHILASVSDSIKAVFPLDYEEAMNEADGDWRAVFVNGTLLWKKTSEIGGQKVINSSIKITETTNALDLQMMDIARGATKESNCWLDPAGCVFTNGPELLVTSTSTSLNDSRCVEIPINHTDLHLNPGERMLFCDSQHAERVGIARAARDGISLDGSTMYVTKFPCRACAMSAIEAGVSTIVFEQGSYGLLETADLFKASGTELKRIAK